MATGTPPRSVTGAGTDLPPDGSPRICDQALVALLDVLGARTWSTQAAAEIAVRMASVAHDKYKEAMRSDSAAMASQVTHAWRQQRSPSGHSELSQREASPLRVDREDSLDIRMFGDTIIVIWAESMWDPPLQLTLFGAFMQKVFLEALEERIALRGAIGSGGLALSSHTALGPAVTDAAGWYDVLDALGVVVSPRCGMLLDALSETLGAEDQLNQFFIRTEAPLKSGGSAPLWSVAWPASIGKDGPQGEQPFPRRLKLLIDLSRFDVPPGTEQKYLNTIRFFDEYERRFGGTNGGSAPECEER